MRAIDKNSASSNIQIPAALKKAKTKNKAACIGFFAVMTFNAEMTNTVAKL
jgi:hypothetical protein